jgi:hypothetical protein
VRPRDIIQQREHLLSRSQLKGYPVKTEDLSRNEKGKRVYLNDVQTRDLMKQLNKFFESYIEIPRMRVGKRQTIETLINEETLLFAKYLRCEIETWVLRKGRMNH